MPAVDLGKVTVGVTSVYTAPLGTALPADTVAEGAAWPAAWTFIGATEEGISLVFDIETNDIRVEESSIPAKRLKTTTNVRLTGALSEDTVATMKATIGGTLTVVAPATGQPGKTVFKLSDKLDEIAVGFEAINYLGFWRRVKIPKAVSQADVTVAYRRAANNCSYALNLSALCLPEEFETHEKTAPATA